MQAVSNISLPPTTQQLPPQQYLPPVTIPTFVSPSMWQESVASVYEGGLKRQWEYDDNHMSSKRVR